LTLDAKGQGRRLDAVALAISPFAALKSYASMRPTKVQQGASGRRNHERGAIAVLMALTLTLFMGFAALGFDLSYVRLARLEMKNATDAAAHAAMVSLSISGNTSTASDMAITIAHLNTVLGKPMKLTSADITFGTYNFNTKVFTAGGTPSTAVQINSQRFSSDDADGLVSLTFGKALGYTESDVTQSVQSAFINRYFQVEVDITDSWICDINNAADAAVSLLTYLNDPTNKAGTPGDWIGLDTFTGSALQMSPLMNLRYNYDKNYNILNKWQRDGDTLTTSQTKGIAVCNKSNDSPAYGGTRTCGSTSFTYANHDWVQHCSDGGGTYGGYTLYAGTDIGAAIKAGKDKIVAASQDYEPRTLIIITDGSPMLCTGIGGGGLCGTWNGATSSNWNPCCANGLTCGSTFTAGGTTYGGGAFGDGSPGAGASGAAGTAACNQAHQMVLNAVSEADAAAAVNIDLYTIGFFSSSTSKGAVFSKSLARNGGYGVTTSDSTQLATLLKAIPGGKSPSIVH
jgi:Flp pilus assembly protein TadG